MNKAERSLTKARRRALHDKAIADLMAPIKLEAANPALAHHVGILWAQAAPPTGGIVLSATARRTGPSSPVDLITFRAEFGARSAERHVRAVDLVASHDMEALIRVELDLLLAAMHKNRSNP